MSFLDRFFRATTSAIETANISQFVEYTEAPHPGGPIVRLDKSMSGAWSVELSDGQYVSLARLARCWQVNNPARGKRQIDTLKIY